jgi:hypothetical protein
MLLPTVAVLTVFARPEASDHRTGLLRRLF